MDLNRKNFSRNVIILILTIGLPFCLFSQSFHYSISVPHPENKSYLVEFKSSGWQRDTLLLKMPTWMPGYYQFMNYARNIEDIKAQDQQGNLLNIKKTGENSWQLTGTKNKAFSVTYSVKTNRQFVANSYVDSEHAYVIPGASFFYVDGYLSSPVSVRIEKSGWQVATGLKPISGKSNEFYAPDFDILYDCPILMGDLETFPPFKVNGVEHKFIAYKPGEFDKIGFMNKLQKVVQSAVDIIGDVPFDEYTFIGIGSGRGGIEHLNNTTVSFNGSNLSSPDAMARMLNFLAHEYFHHYNVKRIRPIELGPFDYEYGNRTNQLWISEGLSVYYEYLIVKRAGLIDTQELLSFFAGNINAHESDSGKVHQSLAQASYSTWEDGPFGNQGGADRSISVYDKGPIVGLLLDFAIRHATENKSSLDNVMRKVYWKYYKAQNRGFTEAEFQLACEEVAGISLSDFFEYIYTTKEINYNKYLTYAGLQLEKSSNQNEEQLKINQLPNLNTLQSAILKSWLGE